MKRTLVKPARARASREEAARVVRFPQLRGKTIRSMHFAHQSHENVLAIHFTDGSYLLVDIRPEPLVWPLDISAGYARLGRGKTWVRRWDRLGD